jgi:murein DD-endopeptidase MepM/ murein hydrolase activator NlpD
VIGYVGQTGHATGAHLHYEFRIDGIHRNPLTAAIPKQNSIAPAHRHQFIAHAKEMMRLLDVHQNLKSIKTKMASNHYQQYITR